MTTNLTPELQKQLDEESKEYAAMFKYGKEYRQNAHFDGAKSCVLKWQEAEQKAARYEKALKEIADRPTTKEVEISKKDGAIAYNAIIEEAREALNPKQPNHDTDSG